VGSRDSPGTSPDHAGRAYVFSGRNGSLLFELVSPNEEEDGFFGTSVSGAGDANQDGHADVIVGAEYEDPGTSPPSAGRAYVFSGLDGSLLFELASPNEKQAGQFGHEVAGAGDVNQDGVADVIVGAPNENPDNSPGEAGRAYVFSGQNGNLLFALKSPNEELQGHFGFSVAGTGDVNQDGQADLVVGAFGEAPEGAGRAYVLSGANGSSLFQLESPRQESSGGFGWTVAGGGDVNKDGVPDVIVGAWKEEPIGHAYVFSGEDGSLLFEPLSPDGGNAFGWSVASAGDFNDDGFADVIVGDEAADPGNGPRAGRAYVFSGPSGNLLIELASPNGEEFGDFGHSVAAAGDVDQDGLPDLIVGAYQEDPGSSPANAGRAYLFVSPGAFRVNSAGPNYTDASGNLFVADRAYAPGGFGYVGGLERRFNQPIGGTDDDPLYQDVRVAREGDADGIFSYRFDVSSPARYDVTLYLMAPALDGAGNVVMDVQAEGDVIFNDLDVTAEAGGEYQALVKTFAVDVNDGTLDLRFRAVNKAALVSAIAVAIQSEARGSESHGPLGGE
jgi:hypothetical protein